MPRHKPVAAKTRTNSLADTVVWRILQVGILVLPLFYWSGKESFRLPKVAAFRATAILVLASYVILATPVDWSSLRQRVRDNKVLLIPALFLAWAAFTTLFASSLTAALSTTINIAAATVLAAAAMLFMPRRLSSLYVLFIPAILNAGLLIIEESGMWHPFFSQPTIHIQNGALLGNPNDVGVFLSIPALVALVLARHELGWRRTAAIIVAVILVAGLATTQTLTALGALLAGVLTFVILSARRIQIWSVVLLVLLAASSFAPPMRERISRAAHLAKSGNWNIAVTGRLSAFLAAWEMFRDRPLLGVGPGCFAREYLPYRFRADSRFAALTEWPSGLGSAPNFGETHNDHLQVLAEFGLPGYLLFLAGLVAIGSASWPLRAQNGVERSSPRAVSRSLGLPLAVTIALLAFAQFPLQMAATAAAIIFVAAAVIRFSRDDSRSDFEPVSSR